MNPTPVQRVSPRLALALTITVTALVIAADLLTGPYIDFAIFKSVALLPCAIARNRKFLWVLCAFLCVPTVAIGLIEGRQLSAAANAVVLINRGITAVTLVLVTMMLHAWINADIRAQESAGDLARQNDELARREQEIQRQNEELQSQTEELERQSEELRVTNEELAQRERTLQSLLTLSRTLATQLAREDTMNRICEMLGELVNGPTTASAILEQ